MHPLIPYSTSVKTKKSFETWWGQWTDVPYTWRYSKGFRQRKPYNLRTTRQLVLAKTHYGWEACDAWRWGPDNYLFPELIKPVVSAVNKARETLVNALGDSSSFGATATAERRQTFGMITQTVIRCATAAKQVRKLQFGSAAATLGLPYKERTISKRVKRGRRSKVVRVRRMQWAGHREVPKTLANGWLMYSYGVKPLMDDIYNGMDVLQRPLPYNLVRGSGVGTSPVVRQNVTNAFFTYQVQCTVKCSAWVQVRNPNLWLANQMGLVNPAMWALEAIPMSFVVDWFSNLSQVVGACTDFTGLDVLDAWQSYRQTFTETWQRTSFDPNPFAAPAYKKEKVVFDRVPGIPTPRLLFAYERFNWQRGLNAISLLIGFLPRR